ncbi:hypothetical protein H4R18_005603, partial [Coemansia javaensis]
HKLRAANEQANGRRLGRTKGAKATWESGFSSAVLDSAHLDAHFCDSKHRLNEPAPEWHDEYRPRRNEAPAVERYSARGPGP